jgi:ketosteroid isomerase-like protein
MSEAVAAEVGSLLHQWAAAYRRKDTAALLQTAIGDEIQLVGTGADEVRFGMAEYQAQADRDFSQSEELRMSISNIRVSAVGDAAFAYCDAQVTGSAGGRPFLMTGLRCTVGLARTADGWRVVQTHLSAPAGGQATGSSF